MFLKKFCYNHCSTQQVETPRDMLRIAISVHIINCGIIFYVKWRKTWITEPKTRLNFLLSFLLRCGKVQFSIINLNQTQTSEISRISCSTRLHQISHGALDYELGHSIREFIPRVSLCNRSYKLKKTVSFVPWGLSRLLFLICESLSMFCITFVTIVFNSAVGHSITERHKGKD